MFMVANRLSALVQNLSRVLPILVEFIRKILIVQKKSKKIVFKVH